MCDHHVRFDPVIAGVDLAAILDEPAPPKGHRAPAHDCSETCECDTPLAAVARLSPPRPR